MPHHRQHIADLAEICRQKGITRVVISPGSRSAPLIKAFYATFGESCISIVDERSAAYFALGIALYTQKPVALICTSGTAVLNYAPALAESNYQKVPLLAFTADRPHEWIDQQDNQTLRQSGIYRNYIKGSYELPQHINTTDDLWHAHRLVNEAINLCTLPDMGPVHINVPLTDPLYEDLPLPSGNLRIIHRTNPEIMIKLPDELVSEWNKAEKIMIIHGQDIPGSEVATCLPRLMRDERVVVIAENIANLGGRNLISNSNLVLSRNRGHSPAYPDLILHSGGQVVSKALTGYLRRAPGLSCWRIGTDKGIIDTFKQVTRIIPYSPAVVYHALTGYGNPGGTKTSYVTGWLTAAAKANAIAEETCRQAPFSDLRIFCRIFRSIPAGTIVSVGNSSIIRYAQIFPASEELSYYSNRGVSGIDGCLSTAGGIALASGKLTLAITGDLGFLYDSNALWNRELPPNLRILLINNGGGGIFHILKGPSDQPGFSKLIEAHHPVNIHKLADSFGIGYFFAGEEKALEDQWDEFMKERGSAALFEVKSDASVSADVFRKMMESS
jgi:2-succinyl-5-enolpyruvyl-6-hydroxy-3-cyclohexene-1-carboxylate synthase